MCHVTILRVTVEDCEYQTSEKPSKTGTWQCAYLQIANNNNILQILWFGTYTRFEYRSDRVMLEQTLTRDRHGLFVISFYNLDEIINCRYKQNWNRKLIIFIFLPFFFCVFLLTPALTVHPTAGCPFRIRLWIHLKNISVRIL